MEQVEIIMSNIMSSASDNISLNAFVVDNICSPLTKFDVKDVVDSFDFLKDLNLAETGESVGNVDILIGCDSYWNFFSGKLIREGWSSCIGE